MTERYGPNRSPFVAAGLSLLCTGLGHLWIGRTVRGTVLLALALLLLSPVWLIAALVPPSGPALGVLLGAAAAALLLYAYAVVDSFRLARQPVPAATFPVPLLVLLGVIGVVYPVGSTALVREYVWQAFKIPMRSMAPTLVPGDRILVNKFTYRFREPQRGDPLVFRSPDDPGRNYIKRIVGLPGEKVRVEDGGVWIDGEKLPQREPPPEDAKLPPMIEEGRILLEGADGREYFVLVGSGVPVRAQVFEAVVPDGSYLVLGDCRDQSRDSRTFGAVPREMVIGLAVYRFFPFGRSGVLR